MIVGRMSANEYTQIETNTSNRFRFLQNVIQVLAFINPKHLLSAINPNEIQSAYAFMWINADDTPHRMYPKGHPLYKYVDAYDGKLKAQYSTSAKAKCNTKIVFVLQPRSSPCLL